VVKANTDQEVKPGWIYVAPANQHLILTEGPVLLWRGPKEDRFRPSINVLFRSAAAAYGRRVVGIVLSGYSHDGTAGLWWIKRSGGIAMVRFPDDAAVPDMPQSALEYVEVDYVLPASKMGGVLGRLAAPRARIRGALSGKA
jgi:two-component system chemotaxis response regulator CheB